MNRPNARNILADCEVRRMDKQTGFDEYTLIDMMFDNSSIDSFKQLWDEDKDAEKWGELLHLCYCEESYESVGGDEGYLENPPICVERLKYLRELIEFLEKLGIKDVE